MSTVFIFELFVWNSLILNGTENNIPRHDLLKLKEDT